MSLPPPVDAHYEDDAPAPSVAKGQVNGSSGLCLTNLRGVRWRIGLGILPSSHSSKVDDFRKAVADSRRRYASLRYRLIMDSQHNSPSFSLDNPLSQNPDSLWVHFFQNAELEKMVEQDLSRLYPEPGSFFQTPAFQTMIRRVLISWCLLHPEHGYKQGMHELLAPLLYVLHVDMQHLLDVRKNNMDHFVDELDWVSFPSTSILSNYVLRKSKKWDDLDDELNGFHEGTTKHKSLDDLDPETRDIILLSDSYGPEGELGILMSERFMEHDAYCIFDALMSGGNGVVAIADFFSPIPTAGSRTGLSPVIESSTAIYHLLSVLDFSLHGHLIALGVEPQYFCLRWLRVLYAREFQLKNLLVMWDEIFSTPNATDFPHTKQDQQPYFKILASARGLFITAMSVSMILHLRSSLLATQNATSCLQKLLNFPDNVDLKRLIEKAHSFQARAFGTNFRLSSPCEGFYYMDKSLSVRGQGLQFGHVTLKAPPTPIPENYWEEKWSLLQKRQDDKSGYIGKNGPFFNVIKGFCKERLGIFGTLMNPGPSKNVNTKEGGFLHSLSQNMFSGISKKPNVVGCLADSRCDEASDSVSKVIIKKEPNVEDNEYFNEDSCIANVTENSSEHFFLESSANNITEDTSLNVDDTMFSTMTSNLSRSTDSDERSRVDLNSVNFFNEKEIDSKDVSFCNNGVAEAIADISDNLLEDDVTVKQGSVSKEKKLLPSKFQWLWKLGGDSNQKIEEEEAIEDMTKSTPNSSGVNGKMESDEDEVMGDDLRNLGKMMLENIQVVESALHQGHCEFARNIENEEQSHAMKSIKELRKISHLLLNM